MTREQLKKAILKAIHTSEERCQFNDAYFNDEYVLIVEPVLNDLLFEVCRQERERCVKELLKFNSKMGMPYDTYVGIEKAIDVIKGLK